MYLFLKKNLLFFIISVVSAILIGFIYQLEAIAVMIILAVLLYFMPQIYRYRKEGRKQEKRYWDLTVYMEQLLCSYKRTNRLIDSLQDCASLYPKESGIGKCIAAAIHIMQTGEGVDDGEIARKSFERIEKYYPSRRLSMLHDFICEAEKMGGQREQALDILLEDVQMWKQRTSLYQKKRGHIRIDTLIALGLASVMCYISNLLTPPDLGFQLSDTIFYQVVTTVVFCGFAGILALVWKKLTGSWLDENEMIDEKQATRLMKQYQILKGKTKANRVKQHLAKRICKRQAERDFPYWLLSITLFLQTDSVYRAMENSLKTIKGIFSLEVKKLLESIYEHPYLLSPYTDFYKELAMPEIQTGMKILYSVNQNGYEDSKKQLDFLVSQNNQLMDKEETNRYENQAAGLSMLKHLPMMLASIKLLADLVNLLVLTMGSFQNLI
jgi:hypothetical protein